MKSRFAFRWLVACALSLSSLSFAAFPSKAAAREWVEKKWMPIWQGSPPTADKLVQAFTEDGVYIDLDIPQGVKGRKALHSYFTKFFAENPNWKYRMVDVFPIETGVVLQWTAEIPLNGKTLKDFRGVDVIVVNEKGLVKKVEEYFDLSPFKP